LERARLPGWPGRCAGGALNAGGGSGCTISLPFRARQIETAGVPHPPSTDSPRTALTPELAALTRGAQRMRFAAGHVIFREGDAGEGMYVIEEGSVEISALIGSRERCVFSHFGPGEYFGEMAVVDMQPRSATAIAETPTVVAWIPWEKVWQTFEQSPKLLVTMMQEFSRRMREFNQLYLYEVVQQERLAIVGRFAQSIVHDFTSPLGNIAFAADLAGAPDATEEERVKANATIRSQADRLADMIGELLEFTRSPSGSVALAMVDYRRFVENTLSDLRTDLETHGVKIVFDNPPPEILLPLDRRRLVHVFTNLINNAIAVMPEGGTITMRFIVTDDEVVTEMEDSGPGIAPEIAGRLFEPFTTHGKRHGTGLGLSICKRIVEDHGGAITARNGPGCGAVFTFALPRRIPRREG
jgi:signal transduction histidine kinase